MPTCVSTRASKYRLGHRLSLRHSLRLRLRIWNVTASCLVLESSRLMGVGIQASALYD
jgi:hypothetical protein